MRRSKRHLCSISLAAGFFLLIALPPHASEAENLHLHGGNSLHDHERQSQFVRGDANCDGRVDISDPAFIFSYFAGLGPPLACEDAADVDDNGQISVPDAITIWNFLGLGEPIPHPYPDPGFDTTFDELTCETTCPYPPDSTISLLDTLKASEVLSSPGESGIPIVIFGSAADTTQSYSISLCYDQTKLNVDSMSLAGTLVDSVWGVQQLVTDFLIWDNEEGWCKVVVSYPIPNPDPPPFFHVLPPFTGQPLAVIYFSVLPDVDVPDTVLLDLQNGCGDVENVFATEDFVSVLPTPIDGKVIVASHALSLSVEPPPPQTIDEGETLSVVITAADNNPDHTVTLGVAWLPSFGHEWDNRSGTLVVVDTLILAPNGCDAGSYDFSFQADCSGGYGVDTLFSLMVNNVNRPPLLDVGPPQIVVAGETVDFVVTATDLDYQECGDDTLVLYAAGLPAGMNIATVTPASWRLTWETAPADTGSYSLILTVEDYYGASHSDTLDLQVVVQAPFPLVRSILDVPNDQGRQVRIRWLGSVYDGPDTTYAIALYAIWRRADGFSGGSDGEIEDVSDKGEMLRSLSQIESQARFRIEGGKEFWDFIETVPAHHDLEYAYVAPTLGDSTSQGVHYSVFFVSAHTPDPDVFFDSPPDSGYSVDNLPPSPPRGLMATGSAGSTILFWRENHEEDLAYYAIYRGACPEFLPAEPLDYVADTTYIDQTMGYCYKVSAFDCAGNESDLSGPVDVKEEMCPSQPSAFELLQNYPNPFNLETAIAYQSPVGGHMSLEIYNLFGQKVRTLVNTHKDANYYTATWDGRDATGAEVGSGVYFCRLVVGKFSQTKRMVILK